MIPIFKKLKTVFGIECKTTTCETLPYERFVSNYIMLNRSNVKVGRETVNLYSKSYLVPDINYAVLTEDEQSEKLRQFADMLNAFDSTVSVQISLLNSPINRADFEQKYLLHDRQDGQDARRHEFNDVIRGKVMNGQNGMQCRKYMTVTVCAVDFDSANARLYNLEQRMNRSLRQLGTTAIPLTVTDRVQLMAEILCDAEKQIPAITHEEYARQQEKQLCCPDSFVFKPKYFMLGDKYARCLFFKRLGAEVSDSIYAELLETNLRMILTENIDFVDNESDYQRFANLITQTRTAGIHRILF